MKPLYKSGKIAQKLGTTTHTLRRWVLRYPNFFTEAALALDRPQPIYTEEDFLVLVSIHQLSAAGYSLEVIEQKLTEGYRYEGSLDELEPLNAPAPSSSESKAIKSLEGVLQQAQQRIAELTSELNETKYRLGVAEGKLEALKEYLVK